MILLIAGSSHTGKTVLARKLMTRYRIPFLSIDHLKMGLIRSGQTDLTPCDDDKLTDYLWPILREMIKTAIENRQSLIIEGCYIPHSWKTDFGPEYLPHIRCRWLIMTRRYVESHLSDIRSHANDAELRLYDDLDVAGLIRDNEENLALCQRFGCDYTLIDETYPDSLEEIYDHSAL